MIYGHKTKSILGKHSTYKGYTGKISILNEAYPGSAGVELDLTYPEVATLFMNANACGMNVDDYIRKQLGIEHTGT